MVAGTPNHRMLFRISSCEVESKRMIRTEAEAITLEKMRKPDAIPSTEKINIPRTKGNNSFSA